MFQHCQSAAVERLKFSVFPWLYLWGKGWGGSSYVCRDNKWHFVLSFSGCEISLVQTENRMLPWEQGAHSEQPFGNASKPATSTLSQLKNAHYDYAPPSRGKGVGIPSDFLPTRMARLELCRAGLGTRSRVSTPWIPARMFRGAGGEVASCPQWESWHRALLCSGRGGDNCRVTALSWVSGRPNLFFLRESMVFTSFGTGISNIFFREKPCRRKAPLQLCPCPNALSLLQTKSLPLFFCCQYLSGISSTTNNASSFVDAALGSSQEWVIHSFSNAFWIGLAMSI